MGTNSTPRGLHLSYVRALREGDYARASLMLAKSVTHPDYLKDMEYWSKSPKRQMRELNQAYRLTYHCRSLSGHVCHATGVWADISSAMEAEALKYKMVRLQKEYQAALKGQTEL